MTGPPVPMSPEVALRHLDAHACDADVFTTVTCPCRDTVAYVCDACDEFVFFAVRAGTWCVHAQQLWEAYG